MFVSATPPPPASALIGREGAREGPEQQREGEGANHGLVDQAGKVWNRGRRGATAQLRAHGGTMLWHAWQAHASPGVAEGFADPWSYHGAVSITFLGTEWPTLPAPSAGPVADRSGRPPRRAWRRAVLTESGFVQLLACLRGRMWALGWGWGQPACRTEARHGRAQGSKSEQQQAASRKQQQQSRAALG